MGKVIVNQFITLDGVVEDPDGSGGTPGGGWAFRAGGTKAVTADGFALGPIWDTGVFLMGRTTWEMFSTRWPNRTGEFADAMNRMPKMVVSHTVPDLGVWSNSTHFSGDLVAGVAELTRTRDVVVIGSTSIVHALAAADAVDEYRLLVVPAALGSGKPLFATPADLQLTSVESTGELFLARYGRAGRA